MTTILIGLRVVALILAGAFVVRYAAYQWWASAEGRFVMGLSGVITAFMAYSLSIVIWGRYAAFEFVSAALFLSLVAVLGYLHVLLSRDERDDD